MSDNLDLAVSDGTRMRAYRSQPPRTLPVRGGILVLQEAFGVNHHIRAVADRFAGLGYLALAPELYHRTAAGFEADYTDFAAVQPHMQALTPAGLEADVAAAHGWLTGPGGLAAERCAAVGFCLGGRVAMLAATAQCWGAAASFYGARLEGLIDRVPRLGCPVLVGWGGKDAHIPLPQRAEFIEAVRQAGKSYVEVTFGDGGHGFLCDERSSYHAASARQAWALLVEFLDRSLNVPAR